MIDEAQLREQSAEIEGLLDEVHQLVPPPAWTRIEEVLRRLVMLYGAGLEHALAHARAAGVTASFDQLVCDDELLASLLVLHGLHPMPTADRIRSVLEAARDALGIPDEALALIAVTDDGTALLHADVDEPTREQLRRAIATIAPEVASVAISGEVP